MWEGTCYHGDARGNERKEFFRDDRDRHEGRIQGPASMILASPARMKEPTSSFQ
jgi:hypothetical protein